MRDERTRDGHDRERRRLEVYAFNQLMCASEAAAVEEYITGAGSRDQILCLYQIISIYVWSLYRTISICVWSLFRNISISVRSLYQTMSTCVWLLYHKQSPFALASSTNELAPVHQMANFFAERSCA